MATSNGSECDLAVELYDLTPLQVVQWVNILTSVLSIIIIFYTTYYYLNRTLFENVTKELVIALYAYIIVFSVCLIITQGSQLAYRYLATTKCDAQVPKKWCVFRYIVSVLISTFVLIHIGITLQFLLSSFHFGCKAQKVAARCSIAASFLYALLFAVLAYYKESLDGRIPYCSGWTAHSEGMLMIQLYLFLILDILNTLVSLFLWKFNERRLITDRQSYDLSLSFHRRQNLYAMQQFLPVAALHAVVYVVFFFTNIFSQSMRSNLSPGWFIFASLVANIIPHYCFLCPLILFILIRRGRFKRESHVNSMVIQEKQQNELYFAALKDQWH